MSSVSKDLASCLMTDDCCICFEKISSEKDRTYLKCGHLFHFSCILKVVNKKCPICRDCYGIEEDIEEMRFYKYYMNTLHLLDAISNVLREIENEPTIQNPVPLASSSEGTSYLQDIYRSLNLALDMLDTQGLDDTEEEILSNKLREKIYSIERFISRCHQPKQEIEYYIKKINKYDREKMWLDVLLKNRGKTIYVSNMHFAQREKCQIIHVSNTDDKIALLQQVRFLNIIWS
jgi:hypothetical protein